MRKSPISLFLKDIQLSIKRSKINASIILKESDENAKYDLFQRLNTGGSDLSAQEVRNCMLVMTNAGYFNWLKELVKNENFVYSTALSEKPLEQSYDVELALRFILLACIEVEDIKSIGDVGIYLTDRMIEQAKNLDFDYDGARTLFNNTFETLEEALSQNSFKRFNTNKDRHEGGFLVSVFEVVALGVAFNINSGTLCDLPDIPSKVQSMWEDRNFTDWAGSGLNASRRLPRLIPYGRELFCE
jgi:hypothetical protein